MYPCSQREAAEARSAVVASCYKSSFNKNCNPAITLLIMHQTIALIFPNNDKAALLSNKHMSILTRFFNHISKLKNKCMSSQSDEEQARMVILVE